VPARMQPGSTGTEGAGLRAQGLAVREGTAPGRVEAGSPRRHRPPRLTAEGVSGPGGREAPAIELYRVILAVDEHQAWRPGRHRPATTAGGPDRASAVRGLGTLEVRRSTLEERQPSRPRPGSQPRRSSGRRRHDLRSLDPRSETRAHEKNTWRPVRGWGRHRNDPAPRPFAGCPPSRYAHQGPASGQ
jgi:hypothetical protein